MKTLRTPCLSPIIPKGDNMNIYVKISLLAFAASLLYTLFIKFWILLIRGGKDGQS